MEMLKLLDVRPTGSKGNKIRWALFLCPICNSEVEKVKSNGLKQKECGCRGKGANSRTHGMSSTRIYKIWEDMKKRCDNANHKSYSRYGGRGISYAKEWSDFSNFYNDMIDGYEDNLTIDRIDVNGNYEPSNCQWLTHYENAGKDNKGRKQSDEWINKRINSRLKTLKQRNSGESQ